MENELLAKVLSVFGHRNCSFDMPNKGYRNKSWRVITEDQKLFNLIIFKAEPEIDDTIRRANITGKLLSDAGMPARIALDERLLQLKTPNRYQLAGLFNYLPGATIPWEAYTMAHIKELGRLMSDMHNIWLISGENKLPSVILWQQTVINRMRLYYQQPGVAKAMRAKLAIKLADDVFTKFYEFSELAKYLPEPQILHMDLVRGNVLFDNEPKVTGVLDFEKVAYGPRVYDIARTVAFLLVDCKYKTEQQVRKYFLQSGYQKRGKANLPSFPIRTAARTYDSLEELIDFYLVYDLYKFMKHNPYEYLEQNAHYSRTRDILISRGLLTLVV